MPSSSWRQGAVWPSYGRKAHNPSGSDGRPLTGSPVAPRAYLGSRSETDRSSEYPPVSYVRSHRLPQECRHSARGMPWNFFFDRHAVGPVSGARAPPISLVEIDDRNQTVFRGSFLLSPRRRREAADRDDASHGDLRAYFGRNRVSRRAD